MFVACVAAMAIIKVDQVVTAQAIVVSRDPTLVVQPMETSIVRSIDVRAGESVHAARCSPGWIRPSPPPISAPTQARSPTTRLRSNACRPKSRQALRLYRARSQPVVAAAIYAQRKSQYDYTLEDYKQKADSLIQTIARANSDAAGYRDRLAVAQNVEQMRRELEKLQVGSR